MAKVFITDWASYNEGTQFEFGKYWDLSEFYDEEELLLEVQNYFDDADKEKPLSCGSIREEFFVSDYEIEDKDEPIRDLFCESFLSDGVKEYYEFHQLEDGDKLKISAYLEEYGNNTSFSEMLEQTEDWFIAEIQEDLKNLSDNEKVGYTLIDEYCYLEVPEHLKAYFDYEKYGREMLMCNISLIEVNGIEYLVEKN